MDDKPKNARHGQGLWRLWRSDAAVQRRRQIARGRGRSPRRRVRCQRLGHACERRRGRRPARGACARWIRASTRSRPRSDRPGTRPPSSWRRNSAAPSRPTAMGGRITAPRARHSCSGAAVQGGSCESRMGRARSLPHSGRPRPAAAHRPCVRSSRRALADHMGVSRRDLGGSVFPDSGSIAPLSGLFRA
jgi:hypothetical protein